MKNIYIISTVSLAILNGCQSLESITPEKVSKFSSPNDLVLKMKLNGNDNKGKDYIYLWHNGVTSDPESLIPKKSLSLYCESQNGKFEPYRVCRRVNILRDYPDDKIKIYS